MYKEKKILAVIPARGGSKRVPKKNIKELGGKPLIAWTIDAAKCSKYLDRCIVSTDSSDIVSVTKELGGDAPFLRPDFLADDKSKTIDVILHSIEFFKKQNENYDYVMILQPTQPLRQSFHIDEAIKMAIDENKDEIVSVIEVNEHPILIRNINLDGSVEKLLKLSSTIRSQDLSKYYKVDGSIYLNKIDENFNQNISLNDNKYAYIMEERYKCDIDTPLDWYMAEYKLKLLLENKI